MPDVNDTHGEREHGSSGRRAVGVLLREARAAGGWTLAQVAGRAGMAASYLSMIENGRVAHPPSVARLRALAEALGIDPRPLLEAAAWEQTPPQVRAQVQRLDQDRAAAVRALAEQIKARGSAADTPRVLDAEDAGAAWPPIPLINKVAAGGPEGYTDLDYPPGIGDEQVPAPETGEPPRSPGVHDPDRFSARVTGESMLPDYKPGDLVVFSPRADVSPGDDCFVRLEPDHEATFKRVFFDRAADGSELIRLQPLNPRFPPRVVPREQVAGMFRAVWRMSPL